MTTAPPVGLADPAILVFAPGLGHTERNTGDRVAEVIAHQLDTRTPGASYVTRTESTVPAPAGLRVSKSVIEVGSRQPVLQVFELDYAGLLEPTADDASPSVVPGVFRSASFAVLAGAKWLSALRRPAKTLVTKMQLGLGLVAALSLVFVALVALYALLVALGVHLPLADRVFGTEDQAASWTFGVAALGLTVTWTAVRRRLLATAGVTERLIRFVKNQDKVADTIALRLDRALDVLRDHGHQGPIHLLGYSFGSLVLYDAMYARTSARRDDEPVATVATLTTIGCPLDLVRLYEPGFVSGRAQRTPGLRWLNVFNQADLFASNLRDAGDAEAGVSPVGNLGASTPPESVRYLDETIGLFQIFVSGRTHSRYWGRPEEASCFGPVVSQLLDPRPTGLDRVAGAAGRA